MGLFVRSRAQTVYNFSLRYLVLKATLSLLRRNPSKGPLIRVRSAEEVSSSLECTCRWDYLWYCKQSNQVPETFHVDEDAQIDEGQNRILAELGLFRQKADQQAEEISSLKHAIEVLAKSRAPALGTA